MKIRKEGAVWVVAIEPNEMMLTATKAYPHAATVGTINARGTLSVWRPVHAPRDWSKLARYKLEHARSDLYARGELVDRSAVKARKEERKTGSFLVKVHGTLITGASGGALHGSKKPTTEWSRFHEFKRGDAWAEKQLQQMLPGAYAAFYRTADRYPGSKLEGAPWTEPYHVIEKNEYGHLKVGNLSGRHPLHGYPGEKKRPAHDRARRDKSPSPLSGPRKDERDHAIDQAVETPRHGRGKLRRELGAIGNALWHLPNKSPWVIYWNGPGARLLFGSNKPGASLSPIEHLSANGEYRTLKEATAAVNAFWRSKS